MKYDLNGSWKLAFTAPEGGKHFEFDASVPGNVEIELERNGLLKNCMPCDDIHAARAYQSVDDWTYSRSFDAPAVEDGWTQELVFEGIDTIADIYLNGEKLYEARDMFIPHRVDVTNRLRHSGNELKVVIRSAMLWARRQEGDVFGISRGHTIFSGQPYLRKARHEWGWDNAPRLLTSGIYRSVYLESLPPERFSDVYLYTGAVTDTSVRLGIVWDYKTPCADLSKHSIHYTLRCKGKTVYDVTRPVDFPRGAERFTLSRSDISLWWPVDMGEPTLCDVEIEMLCDGARRASFASKWGIRTLRLERTEDISEDNKGEFVFVVNNERVYIRGTNWKPLDALHSRADQKVERVVDLARDLNCNMIRIWGGGIYEDTAFFEACDRLGIMVWQDFMFGCEFPPMDDWYCQQVEQETAVIIRKLRNHASLAVWCGDNEDDECMTWNHQDSTILDSDNRISRQVLKKCVLRYDPYRSYVESSPYASDANIMDRRRGHMTHFQPEAHLYPPTLEFDKALRACRSRFIGETGPIPVFCMTDNARIFPLEERRARRLWNEPLAPWQRNTDTHQVDDYFKTWRQAGKELCEVWFGRDFTVDKWKDYCLAVNIICGDVYKDAIEYCRASRWDKTGVIWWSLYDMWPMLFNNSVVDVDFQKKMPYYWIRQSQQAVALMAVRREIGGEVWLYAVNDTLCPQKGEYRVAAVDALGNERSVATGAFSEPVNSARPIQRMPEGDETALWLIEWTVGGKTYYNHFVTGSKHCNFEVWRNWSKRLNALYGAD